jgi:hypothetical protein
MDIVTASNNGYFVSVTEAKKIVSVTLLPLLRHKKCIDYLATVTEA